MRKYRYLLLILLIFLLLNSACSRKTDKEDNNTDDIMKYEVKNFTSYTVDNTGALYIGGFEFKDENTSEDELESTTYIQKYAPDGSLVFTHTLEKSIPSIDALTVNGDIIYFAVPGITSKGIGVLMHSYNMKTDELECICEFDYFESIKQLIYLDERIYLIGYKPYSLNNTNASEGSYQSMGEKLVYYSLKDKLVYEIGVKYPISMAANGDSLMINAYMENDGYCLLNYNTKKDSLKLAASYDSDKINNFAVCDGGKKIIYAYDLNSRGLVISDLAALDKEAELYPDVFSFNNVYHVNGQVYCVTWTRDIVRIALDSKKMNYSVIRYISSNNIDAPFGCGYTMERKELTQDKLAVKVLSQDKDYDLCYIDSSSYISHNIRKNGIFLPLNKLKRINEYLDACFPYVKEVAINENGDIWMLPVSVNIPGFLVNEEYLAKEAVPLENNITYEEFLAIYEKLDNDLLSKTSFNTYLLHNNFIAQTINKNMNLDERFGDILKKFQKYNNMIPKTIIPLDLNKDFLFDSFSNLNYFSESLKMIKNPDSLRVYSMPKLDPTDKNTGTCSFLIVNANSDNKKTVLAYLEDLIAYIMNQETTPFFFKEPVPEKDTLRGSIYDLYENGEISFYIDSDTYSGLTEVIESGSDQAIEEYIQETERKLRIYFNE